MKKVSKKVLAQRIKEVHVYTSTEQKITNLVVKMLQKKKVPTTLDRDVIAMKSNYSIRTVDRVLHLMKLRGNLEKVNKNLFRLK